MGQTGNDANFLDEIFNDSYNSIDQANIEEEIRQLQELQESFVDTSAAGSSSTDSGAAAAGPFRLSSLRSTTSADKVLLSLVEKSLLSLANSEPARTQKNSEGQIRNLLSDMMDTLQTDPSDPSDQQMFKPLQNIDAECEQLLGQLPGHMTGNRLLDSMRNPIFPVKEKPKPEVKPKPKPEKPEKVTLKYLLETIDGDNDDDLPEVSNAKIMPSFFKPPVPPKPVSTITSEPEKLTTTIEPVIEPIEKPVEIEIPAPKVASNFEQDKQIAPIEPIADPIKATPITSIHLESTIAKPVTTATSVASTADTIIKNKQPISIDLANLKTEKIEKIEKLEKHQKQEKKQTIAIINKPKVAKPVKVKPVKDLIPVIDLEAEIELEEANTAAAILAMQLRKQKDNNNKSSVILTPKVETVFKPVIKLFKPIDVPIQIPPTPPSVRPSSPDQQICVELLNDIVEMASDSARDKVRPPLQLLDEKTIEDKKALVDSKNALHDDLMHCDKTTDSEVSKLFSQTTSKRRRSIEVFVSLSSNNDGTSSSNKDTPSPLISSSNCIAKRLRSSKLKSTDDLTSLTKKTKSRSSPIIRTASPGQYSQSPTPITSTSSGDLSRDFLTVVDSPIQNKCNSNLSLINDHTYSSECNNTTWTKSPKASVTKIKLPDSYRKIVDYEDDDCEDEEDSIETKMTKLDDKNQHDKSHTKLLNPPTSMFRTRSRSLVIDVRNAELSLKTTSSSNNTDNDVIFEFCGKRTKKPVGRPAKKAKVETITSSTEEDGKSTLSVEIPKEPSVQHPDISSSVDDDEKSCRYKHRNCCCQEVEEELDEESEEQETEERQCNNTRHHCCRHHCSSQNGSGCGTKGTSNQSNESHSVMVKTTTSGGQHTETPPPVTIHHHTGSVSINFKTEIVLSHAAENATTIIHINPSKTTTSTSGNPSSCNNNNDTSKSSSGNNSELN